jgi:hypothetical protein
MFVDENGAAKADVSLGLDVAFQLELAPIQFAHKISVVVVASIEFPTPVPIRKLFF